MSTAAVLLSARESTCWSLSFNTHFSKVSRALCSPFICARAPPHHTPSHLSFTPTPHSYTATHPLPANPTNNNGHSGKQFERREARQNKKRDALPAHTNTRALPGLPPGWPPHLRTHLTHTRTPTHARAHSGPPHPDRLCPPHTPSTEDHPQGPRTPRRKEGTCQEGCACQEGGGQEGGGQAQGHQAWPSREGGGRPRCAAGCRGESPSSLPPAFPRPPSPTRVCVCVLCGQTILLERLHPFSFSSVD